MKTETTTDDDRYVDSNIFIKKFERFVRPL